VGHGTAVAMVAAGVVHESPRGVISGVAPGAWIGNYRVNIAGSRSIPSDFAVRGFNAAVDDGMNVINMSFGSNGLFGSKSEILEEAASNASDRGVIIVVSSGNSGPEIMTVDDTSAHPKVLSVGANQSDNIISTPAILLPDGAPITNVAASSNASDAGAFGGELYDVAQFDPTGLLCGAAPPAGSLTGAIPLIQRGECNFTVKLRNAFLGGAAAAIIYNSANPASGTPDDLFIPDVESDPTIPAAAIGRTDGLRLKTAAAEAEEYQVVVRFFSSPNNPYQLAGFSSIGPSVDLTIKPDLVATGQNVYTAAQTLYPGQSIYDETGYTTIQGTSFAAPAVAGAAAALMAARPWLHSSEYRSMLVNSAEPLRRSDGKAVTVVHSGAGALNVERALRSTVTAYPVSLSFGAQGSTVDDWRQVIIRNITNTTNTYDLSLESDDAVLPLLTAGSVTLGPGEIAGPVLIFAEGGLAPGAYQGFLRIDDTENGTTARVPYWMAVRDTAPATITLPWVPSNGRSGSIVEAYVRVHDAAGIPIPDYIPTLAVELGNGSVETFQPSAIAPGALWLRFRLGPGTNRVRVDAGSVSRTFSITGTL
jgi:minor extracellular serine protease Vpr